MTVPSSVAKSGPYNCNGVTDVFNYDFRIVDKTHLNVILANAAGVETTLDLTTHYTVSDVGSDVGSINLTSAGVALAVTGTKLTILRNPPFTQETDLQNQGAYLAQTVEDRFDLLTMQVQTVKERSDRSIAIPASDEGTTMDKLSADLVKVAGIADDVSTVSANIADVNTAATNIAAIIDAPNQAAAAANSATAAALSEANAATYEGGAEAAQAAAETAAAAAQDALSSIVPTTFSTKAAAEAYNPDVAPDFVALTGGSEVNDIGAITPFTKVSSEPADLPAPGIVQLLDGTYYRWAGREFPLELGAKGDGITDNSSFFEDLSAAMVDFNGVIVADRGIFKTNKTLVVPKQASFKGAGRSNTLITAAGSTGTFENDAVITKAGGLPTKIDPLASDVLFGDRQIAWAADQGLSPDDLLLLQNPTPYSYAPWRSTYCAGEFVRVMKNVDAVTARLTRAIYSEGEWSGVSGAETNLHPGTGGTYAKGGYKKATLDVYLCDDFASGEVSGMSIVAPGAGDNAIVQAFAAIWCRDLTVRDMAFAGSLNASASLSHVYNGIVEDFTMTQRGNGGFGTQYGLMIGDSQHIKVQNFYGEADRHVIATGGGTAPTICNRDIVIQNGTACSNDTATIAAVDFHGNIEWGVYRNLSLSGGGIDVGGNHTRQSNIDILVSSGFVLYAGELTGCDHTFQNIKAVSLYNDASRGVIDIGGNSTAFSDRTARGGTFVFDDVEVYATNHGYSNIYIRNRGFSAEPWRVSAKGIEYKADAALSGQGASVLSISTVSGNPPASVTVNDLRAIGSNLSRIFLSGNDVAVPVSGLRASGKVTGNTSTGVGLIDIAVTFPFTFPKIPNVTISVDMDNSSNDRLGAFARGVSTTGFTFRVRRVDDAAGNFTGAVAIKGSWSASLDEG